MSATITPDIQEKLNYLENILSEFYAPNTNNTRKNEIENMFEDFSNEPNVWKHIRDFLKFSSNFYVIHFSLMVIENTLKIRGVCSDNETWTEMKWLLQSRVLDMECAPFYIINKIIQLNAHIARIDWPHFYPEYFPHIFKLIQNSNNEFHVKAGSKFLQITSEEFLSPREDISYSRKNELRTLLQTRVVPEIFSVLLRALEQWKNNLKICTILLEALEQYFSWVPLGDVYHVGLINCVCQFTSNLEIGTPALAVLNEVLYKALVPVSFLPVLCHVISHSFNLLQSVSMLNLNTIPEDYIKKVTENIKLVVSTHWHRVESMQQINRIDFLNILLNYTFLPSCLESEHIFECLDIWSSLLDYLHTKNNNMLTQYEPIFRILIGKLFERIESCSTLDDETLNEDNKTERQTYLDNCIDTISKTTDVFQEKSVALILQNWAPANLMYSKFLRTHQLSTINDGLLCAMSSYTQVLTRVHSSLDPHRAEIVRSLAQMALDFTQSQMYMKPEFEHISKLLIQLQVEILASLKCWLTNHFPYDEIIFQQCQRSSLPLVLDPSTPSKLAHSGAHLLACVILKKPFFDLQPLEILLGPNSLLHLPLETRVVIEHAIVKSILTKCKETPNEKDPENLELLTTILNMLFPSNILDCYHLSLLLPHCQLQSKDSKSLFCTALNPWLNQVILEFPSVFQKNNFRLCEDMLSFFLEAFRIIQDQMSLSMLQSAVQSFIDCFKNGMVPESQNVLDKLFTLLIVIIEQPSSQFRIFVPSSLGLCTELINIEESHVPKLNAYKLLAVILLEKWQYFFRGSQIDPDAQTPFTTIIQCLGQSCTHSDISLFSQNLKSLEEIHKKWRLYDKDIFKVQFLKNFLSVLLNVLIEKQHVLLSEDIILTLFHMAQVDINVFYSDFLPHFLMETTGIDDRQRRILHSQVKTDVDLSTFSQNINQLANDIRCYKSFNLYSQSQSNS